MLLCSRFLGAAAKDLGYEEVPELTTETLDFLQRCPWRGNIRELRHVLNGAVLRAAGGPIEIEHLDIGLTTSRAEPEAEGAPQPLGSGTWKDRLELQERAALKETLDRADGNLTRAAGLFGVPRTTYREKLVKYGLLKAKS